MKKTYLAIIAMAVILLPGCAHHRSWRGLLKPNAFMNLSLGTKKQEVVAFIGEPDVVRGAMINKSGQSIEVWEYRVDDGTFAYDFCPIYWLYFHDNKLVQWNKAGDWKKESDHIQEIRFR